MYKSMLYVVYLAVIYLWKLGKPCIFFHLCSLLLTAQFGDVLLIFGAKVELELGKHIYRAKELVLDYLGLFRCARSNFALERTRLRCQSLLSVSFLLQEENDMN
jgi:hypothetical protein